LRGVGAGEAARDVLADQDRGRIEHLLFGTGVEHQGVGEMLEFRQPGSMRRRPELLEHADDLPVLGEHLRQLGLQAPGHGEHLGHLRSCSAGCEGSKQPQRRKRELLFGYEVRMQQPRHLACGLADRARYLCRPDERRMQLLVFDLKGLWNLEFHD